MNPIDILLNHRTIRAFKMQRFSPAQLSVLLDVAKQTATSMGLQTFSIIHIVDQAKKEAIAQVAQQDYLAKVPELFIFVVDVYRNARIAEAQGLTDRNIGNADQFLQGWTDACLAAQNMVCASELAGFGTVYFGSILNDAEKMVEILELPPLTFPVVGLGVGIPAQKPQLKPRMPRQANVFDDTYQVFDDYMELLEDYDEEMSMYYDSRDTNNRVDSFTQQVLSRCSRTNPLRESVFAVIQKQGFVFDGLMNDKE